MNVYLFLLSTMLASYGLFEMFLMAVHSQKERRPFVILHIAGGFAFCLWVMLDKSLINAPMLLGLLFIASDRLQTRLLRKKVN